MLPEGATKDDIARIVYDYVTESTRYVSVQLGIGGLKPFLPSEVYELKYGDCKALSFYTAKILEHYGIEAIYTEIRSERSHAVGVYDDLPGPFLTNHIVLCLPNEGDTTWLECTTGSYFYGYAHTGIDNRKAVLISSEGGKVVTTKKYSAKENRAIKEAHISMGKEDKATIKMNNRFYNQRHETRTRLIDETKEQQAELLRKYFFSHLPKYSLETYEIETNKKAKYIDETATIETDYLIEKAGHYIILPYMVEYVEIPQKLELKRELDIYLKNAKSDSISISLQMPDGYQIVSENKDLNFSNEFGSIEVTKELKDGDTFIIEAVLTYNEGTFPSSSVLAYNEFVDKIHAFAHDKVIFKPM